MSPWQELFRRASAATLSLNGGCAPRRLRHELRRCGARLDTERRATHWVLGMADVLPALRDGPLWGDYLAQLVAWQANQHEPNAASRRAAQAATPHTSHSVRPERRNASVAERRARAAPVARRPEIRSDGRLEDIQAPRAGNVERAGVPSNRATRSTRGEDSTRQTSVPTNAATVSEPSTEPLTLPELKENSSYQSHGADAYEQHNAVRENPAQPQSLSPVDSFERHNAVSASHTTGDIESREGATVVGELPLRVSHELLSRLLAPKDLQHDEQAQVPGQSESTRMTSAAARWATTSVKSMPASMEVSGVSGKSGGSTVGVSARNASVGSVSSFSSTSADRNARRAMSNIPGAAKTSTATLLSNLETSTRLRQVARLAQSARRKASLPERDKGEGGSVGLISELVTRAGRSMWRGSIRPLTAAQLADAPKPLAEQWSLSLKGETASLGLLSALAVVSLGGAVSGGGELDREKAAVARVGHDDVGAVAGMHEPHTEKGASLAPTRPVETMIARAQDFGAAWPSQRGAGGNGHGMSAGEDAMGVIPTSEMLTSEMLVSEELRQRHERAGSHRPEGVNVLMPGFINTDARGFPAPELPPLIPPYAVDGPVLPVAVATARQGARVEAKAASELSEPSPEDLDALAEKIKLILDEQARRHGIDV